MNAIRPTYSVNRSAFALRRWVVLIGVTAFLIVFFLFAGMWVQQYERLIHQEKIQTGKGLLAYLVQTAAFPLADADLLTLSLLMKETKTNEGIVYAAVVDNKGIVVAHTDIRQVGTTFDVTGKGSRLEEKNGTTMERFTLPEGTSVLDLSRPVELMQRRLGVVHVGLSESLVKAEARRAASEMMRSFLWPAIVLWGVLMGAVVLLWVAWHRTKGQETARVSIGPMDDEPLEGGDAVCPCAWETIQKTGGTNPADGCHLPVAQINQNHVTVLFAGIKGFRAYAELNDHQKLIEDLNDYLDLVTRCMEAYGGHIDKFVGDSVIAVFGNSPHEADHAERALKAAVATQKALQERGRQGNPLLLKVGIGINSGVVLTGCIGSPDQGQRVFIGESIKVAYSLNFMAGPGEIVMTREAYRMVEHLVLVEPIPPQVLMQRTQPWENFRLMKLRSSKG